MLAGVFEDFVFLRIPPEEQDALLSQFHELKRFEPNEGQIMREYMAMSETLFSNPVIRKKLIKRAIEHVLQLPPK